MTDKLKDKISSALGFIPTGIFILTAGTENEATGMLASFVQQVGFTPPMIIVAVHEKRPILSQIRNTKAFAINICHKQNSNLVNHFVKGFAPGQPALEGLQITTALTNTPILSESLAYLDCSVKNEVTAGDHVIFVGEVIDGSTCTDGEPMVRIRKNGFDY